MRARIVQSAFVLMCAVVAAAGAVPVTMTAKVSSTTVTVGETFSLAIYLSAKPDKLTLPTVEGLTVGPPTTAVNPVTGERTLDYKCTANRPGRIAIPAIVAVVEGKEFVTDPLIITAVAATGRPRRANPGDLTGLRDEHLTNRQATMDDVMMLQANVDKTEVFQGEALTFDLAWWRIRSRGVRMGRSDALDPPSFEGFYAVKKPDQATIEQANGFSYEVFHQQWVLYPTHVGSLTIPASEMSAEAVVMGDTRAFFQPFKMTTNPIVINVNPLPPRPEIFSGAVGKYKFQPESVEVAPSQGVPFLAVVRVIGEGNPDAIGEPYVAPVEWAQISEPETSIQDLGAGVHSKVFAYKVTPLTAGAVSFPEMQFCYFDPEQEKYVTLTSPPISMIVAVSPEGQRQLVHGSDVSRQVEAVSILSQGLLPLDMNPDELRPRRLPAVAVPAAAAAPALAYVALVLLLQRNRRYASDTALARAYRARQRAHKSLQDVAGAADPVEVLYRAATQFLADCHNLPEGGITYTDARVILARMAVEPATAEKLLKVIRACERQRYAGAQLSRQEVLALVHAAEEAVEELDRVLRREGTA